MCLSTIFGGAQDKSAKLARQDEMARQGRISAGTAAINDTFGQFNDDFFNNQRKSYIDYATPQLEDQHADAVKQLTYALARTGNLGSSARASQEAKLQQTYDLGKQGIADQGQTFANTARTNVEDARSGLIAALNASGDATQAASGAIARSAALSTTPAYSPIGQLFSTLTSGAATQAAAEQATGLYGGYSAGNTTYQSPVNTGLFGKSGSVKVTN